MEVNLEQIETKLILEMESNSGFERSDSFFKPMIERFNLNKESFTVLQIIDVTSNIQMQRLSNEKKMLMIINAIVSHEMRNPIHSIQC